jgi:hypothetical protein
MTRRQNNTGDMIAPTVKAIVNDLNEKTDELGFCADTLIYASRLKDRFIKEDNMIEAAIVATYIWSHTEEEPDENRFEYSEETRAIALELGLETADRYTQEFAA